MKLILIFFIILFNVHLLDAEDGPNSMPSESYNSLTFDGAWCWFSDPRAVFYEGKHQRTYVGWIDSYGDIHIGFYDHKTQQIESTVLYDNLEIDDHDNPALLFRPDGRLMVFFTKHSKKAPTWLFTMKNPEDIKQWDKQELFLNDTSFYKDYKNTNTYVNPVLLSEENNRLYLFWRGMDFKPNYAWSDDFGKTWSPARILLIPERVYERCRPYMKVTSNGKDKIFFTFTDGHPRTEEQNSVYFMYYQKGALFTVDDNKIKDLDDKPLQIKDASILYDAKTTGDISWIWDIAVDDHDRPYIAYVRFPNDSNHVYYHTFWDGEKWQTSKLLNAGGWFPETESGIIEKEPNYSGGMSLDAQNPNVVYLSAKRDSVFEIEKWSTKNEGKSWQNEFISQASENDNVRPFAVRNAQNDLKLLWMQNTKYTHYRNYLSAIKMYPGPKIKRQVYTEKGIRQLMRQVADWQLSHPFTGSSRLNWHWGAFYTGLMTLYETTGKERYLNEMINLGQSCSWKPLDDIYHADRLVIGDMFTWMYLQKENPEMLEKIRWALDIHLARRSQTDVHFENNPYRLEWWSWCDALYMAPPTFARMYAATGEEKYLEYASQQWWKTSDYLYSQQDSLFYRDDRFFDKKSSNGHKVFWGRGNSWVIAGLARMLKIMPQNFEFRQKFETQFKEMANKMLKLQQAHGLWTASLYDPDELPFGESSASAFITFALAWGVNNGLLDAKQFKPAVKKAWQALCNNVNENGRLGYVQQVAGDPYPFYEYQWHVYASGAFLLCGQEMIELIDK